ncbi:MAG: hypothetical protein WCV90_04185 [Candidatus Woesearchaeota archaeon]|jgi:hypothetical protein
MGLEPIVGGLEEVDRQGALNRVLCADRLMKEQREGTFIDTTHTGDGEIYFMDGDTPKLALTRTHVNPILWNPREASKSFSQLEGYRLSHKDFNIAMSDSETLVIDITKIRYVERYGYEIAHFIIGFQETLAHYIFEEEKLLRRILGPTEQDFKENGQMLSLVVSETTLCFYTPEYVKEHTKKGPFAHVGYLINPSNTSVLFNATAPCTRGNSTRFYIESGVKIDQPATEEVSDTPRKRRIIDVQDLDEKWL